MPDDAFGNTTELRLLPFGSPASHALYEYAEKIGGERRSEPQDDIVTKLVLAEHEGDSLSAAEYRNFFHVLVFAGNETREPPSLTARWRLQTTQVSGIGSWPILR